MTKLEIGLQVFALIREHLEANGYTITRFPPDFPVSRRTCYNIRAGDWTPETLKKLPFPVEVGYSITAQQSEK